MKTNLTLTFSLIEDTATLVAGGCTPCQMSAIETVTFATDAPSGGDLPWSGVIVEEGVLTGDGRMIQPNALMWSDLPIPLRHAASDTGAHQGAVVVGRINTIERQPDGKIFATGDFDSGSEAGVEAARQVAQGLTPGVSVDLDNVSFEVRVAQDALDAMESGPAGVGQPDESGRVLMMDMKPDDEVMVTTDARIRAATLVAIPAFAGAKITLDAQPEVEAGSEFRTVSADERDQLIKEGKALPDGSFPIANCADLKNAVSSIGRAKDPAPAKRLIRKRAKELNCPDFMLPEGWASEAPALVAAAAPVSPPTEWFADPHLSQVTPLTITKDGRIFGHLAAWETCHTAFPGQCVTPPSSPSGYAYFKTGAVLTAEGTEVAVGTITMDTLHASRTASATSTLAHYENTGRASADVVAGEDAFGIWVAGAIRPGLSDEQIRSLRAAPLSGDWRKIGGSLELVGALAVNVPGFPIPRPQGLVAGGAMTALVASGVLSDEIRAGVLPTRGGTPDDLASLRRAAARLRVSEARGMASRIAKQRAAALAARVAVPSFLDE